jgi:hypothetical protein
MKLFKTLFFLFISICTFAQKGDSSSAMLQNKTAWLLSSNFTIPSVQFLPYKQAIIDAKTKDGKGSVSFFNSIGAGLSLSKADFTLLSSKADTSGIDIKNHIGVQLGFIFSRSAGQTTDNNRFAFYTGISILDFQLGLSSEFGDIGKDFKRTFYSISYSIPLSKFSKKTTLVFKNKGGLCKQKDKLTKISKALMI